MKMNIERPDVGIITPIITMLRTGIVTKSPIQNLINHKRCKSNNAYHNIFTKSTLAIIRTSKKRNNNNYAKNKYLSFKSFKKI